MYDLETIRIIFIVSFVVFCYSLYGIAVEMSKRTGNKKFVVGYIVLLCCMLAGVVLKIV